MMAWREGKRQVVAVLVGAVMALALGGAVMAEDQGSIQLGITVIDSSTPTPDTTPTPSPGGDRGEQIVTELPATGATPNIGERGLAGPAMLLLVGGGLLASGIVMNRRRVA